MGKSNSKVDKSKESIGKPYITSIRPLRSNNSQKNSKFGNLASATDLDSLRKCHSFTDLPEKSCQVDTQLIVLYDFNGRKNGDLSIKKGDTLLLKRNSDSFWWYCENAVNKKCGFVPSNYVKIVNDINDEPWYFGYINKHVSEKHLLKSTVKGTFLVRDCYNKHQASYTLSVYDGTLVIKHYRIKQSNDHKFYISLYSQFSTVEQLITYYRLNSTEELCVTLTNFPLKLIPSLSPDDNTWYVPNENFKFLEMIGMGNFGQVWKAIYKNKYYVAAKMFKIDSMTLDEFLNEANIMKKLNHPNLVDLLGICRDSKPMFIVMEYMDNGNLLEYLKSQNAIMIPIFKQINIFKQISNGMSYLEANNLVHRDLAARNILVNKELKFKIADFGLTNFLARTNNSSQSLRKIPLRWSAPEVISEGKYSSKSDIWSFGIVMYEVATNGTKPYGSLKNKDILTMLDDGYRLPCPKHCHKVIYKIMIQCWNHDFKNRPTFLALSSLFQEFNINNI